MSTNPLLLDPAAFIAALCGEGYPDLSPLDFRQSLDDVDVWKEEGEVGPYPPARVQPGGERFSGLGEFDEEMGGGSEGEGGIAVGEEGAGGWGGGDYVDDAEIAVARNDTSMIEDIDMEALEATTRVQPDKWMVDETLATQTAFSPSSAPGTDSNTPEPTTTATTNLEDYSATPPPPPTPKQRKVVDPRIFAIPIFTPAQRSMIASHLPSSAAEVHSRLRQHFPGLSATREQVRGAISSEQRRMKRKEKKMESRESRERKSREAEAAGEWEAGDLMLVREFCDEGAERILERLRDRDRDRECGKGVEQVQEAKDACLRMRAKEGKGGA